MMSALEILKTFDERSLPDLDTVVLGALEFFKDQTLPVIDSEKFQHPLVIGSGNAAVTGAILFGDGGTIVSDESSYTSILAHHPEIDAVFIVSASGGKHAISIVESVLKLERPVFLFTNNPEALAARELDASHVHIFPKVREPYTYNTSTYMGMLLAKSKEDTENISTWIHTRVAPQIPDTLATYNAFFLIVPPAFNEMRSMFTTKFDELFGPKVLGRVFTLEQTKHAKTVIPSDTECFISFGEENTLFGKPSNRIHIPLTPSIGHAGIMAIVYYIVGQIQKQHPPYFKENIVRYAKETSELFGQNITPIVD